MAEIGGGKRRSARSSFGPMLRREETEHFVPEQDEEEAEMSSGMERYPIAVCRHWRRIQIPVVNVCGLPLHSCNVIKMMPHFITTKKCINSIFKAFS